MDLGGNRETPVERPGWERGEVRTLLGRRGCSGLENLFETRRRADRVETRLALSPDRIELG